MPRVWMHYGSNDPDYFIEISDDELEVLKDIETRSPAYLCDTKEGREFLRKIEDAERVKPYDHKAYVYA